MCSCAAPGSVLRLSGADIGNPGHGVSTHGYGLAMAVALARALRQLPATLVLLGLEADPQSGGKSLSPPLVVVLPDFVRIIEQEVLMTVG